jgi:hypothetical protein
MNYKTNMLVRIAIGGAMPIVLIVLVAFHVLNMKLVMGIIGTMAAVYVFYYLNKRPDERTKRLDAYARNLSWLFTFFFLLALGLICQFKIVTLNSNHLIALIYFSMVYSYWIINFIISGRSDVAE